MCGDDREGGGGGQGIFCADSLPVRSSQEFMAPLNLAGLQEGLSPSGFKEQFPALAHAPLSLLGCPDKIPQTGCLHSRSFFLTVLEVGKSKIRVPAWSGSWESPLPGLQMAVFLLCP